MRNLLKIFSLLLFFGFFAEVLTIADRIGCRDESGELVDWFYLYKLPSRHEGEELNGVGGLRYLYVTSLSFSDWTMSERFVNETNSMPGKTLSMIYERNPDNLVMIYNDEPTKGETDGTRGHTKGVVVANDISGFWLVHSVPKFPPALDEGSYGFPQSGTIYGQSFLCISFTGDQMDKVGKQLKFNEPHFYSSFVPEYLKTWVESLKLFRNLKRTNFIV